MLIKACQSTLTVNLHKTLKRKIVGFTAKQLFNVIEQKSLLTSKFIKGYNVTILSIFVLFFVHFNHISFSIVPNCCGMF